MGIDTSKIGGEINADIYKNMIAGYNAGTKTITLQELANLGDERAINALANGANPYTTVNNSIGRDLLNNISGLNDARINNLNAKTKTEDLLRDAKYQKIMNDINTAQHRVAIARQKLANGTISASDYAKELKNWTSLVNALDKYEGLSDDTKAIVGKPPVRQQGVATPAPQAQPKKSGVTKNGVKWEVVE